MLVAVKAKGEVAEGVKAEVYLNGESKGTVGVGSGKGLCIYAANGDYTVRIEAAGYQAYEKSVKVRGMNPGTWVEATLQPVVVENTPAEDPADK